MVFPAALWLICWLTLALIRVFGFVGKFFSLWRGNGLSITYKITMKKHFFRISFRLPHFEVRLSPIRRCWLPLVSSCISSVESLVCKAILGTVFGQQSYLPGFQILSHKLRLRRCRFYTSAIKLHCSFSSVYFAHVCQIEMRFFANYFHLKRLRS